MNISIAKTNVDTGSSAYGAQIASNSSAVPSISIVKSANKGEVTVNSTIDDNATKKPVTVAELKKITAAMNQFVETMDTNIRFKFHEKTKELMVQVVDQSNNKVLKEIPSKEFLDTIAVIRSVVGMMLDKKM